MKRFLSLIMVAGMAIPMGTIQAWPWKGAGAAPLAVEKQVKVVAKEAQKSKITDYALAGAALAGKTAGKTLLFTAEQAGKFALANPGYTTCLVAGGYLYYKHKDEIHKAFPYLKTGLMGLGAYKACDMANQAYQATSGAISNLFGNKKEAVAVQPQIENKAQNNQIAEFAEYNDLWDQFERENKQALVQERAQKIEAQMKPMLTPAEIKSMDAAWHQSNQAPVASMPQAQRKAEIEIKEMDTIWNESKAALAKEANASKMPVKEPLLLQTPAEREEAAQLVQRFEREFHGQEYHAPFQPHINLFQARLSVQKQQQEDDDQKNAWVDEYHEKNAIVSGCTTEEEWHEEFKNLHPHAAEETEAVTDVESIEDNRAYDHLAAYRRINTLCGHILKGAP